MALPSTMYAAKVNSPATMLTADIDSDDLSFPVADCAVFDAGPNLIVLGLGTDAETCLFASRSAGSGAGTLTITTRAVNGTAKAWSAGTIVAIRYTASAHDAVKANLEYLETYKAPLASPTFTGVPAAPTAAAGTNTTQIATTAFVQAAFGNLDTLEIKGGIDCSTNPNFPAADSGHLYYVSVAGKIGGASGETVEAGDALVCKTNSSPVGDLATVGTNWIRLQTNMNPALYALLASPTFTGTPAAPTAAVDTNTTQIATTAFVLGQAASVNPENIGTTALGSSYRYARRDHVHALSADTPEQGDIVYRGASAFNLLPHSTAYYVLRSGGHGANPSWGKIDGGSP